MAAIDGNNVTFVAANDVKKRKVDELKNDSVTRITPPNSDMGSLLSDKELQAILSTSKGSSVATGRAQLPTYRIDLGNHGVYIDSSATRVPKCVLNLAETILSRKSNLPTPTWEHVLESKTLLERISESEEANIQGMMTADNTIFPSLNSYLTETGKWQLATDSNTIFKTVAYLVFQASTRLSHQNRITIMGTLLEHSEDPSSSC